MFWIPSMAISWKPSYKLENEGRIEAPSNGTYRSPIKENSKTLGRRKNTIRPPMMTP